MDAGARYPGAAAIARQADPSGRVDRRLAPAHGDRARERDGLIVFERYGQEPAVGDEIEVVEGPLKGLRGIFRKEIGDTERVMILLNYVSYQGLLLIEKDKLKKA